MMKQSWFFDDAIQYARSIIEQYSLKDNAVYIPNHTYDYKHLNKLYDLAELKMNELNDDKLVIAMSYAINRNYLLCMIQGGYVKKINYIVLSRIFSPFFQIGAYKSFLEIFSFIEKSNHLCKSDNYVIFRLYKYVAKAYRDIGKIDLAFEYYRKLLTIAKNAQNIPESAKILVLIAKIYGNILGQTSVAIALTNVSKDMLKEYLDKNRNISYEMQKAIWREISLCNDSLGQFYRLSQPEKSIRYFEESLYTNHYYGNRTGVARSAFHLYYIKLSFVSNEIERNSYLIKLSEVIDDLCSDMLIEGRGLGVRLYEYSTLLHKYGQSCQKILSMARQYAEFFSDKKTLVKINFLTAKIFHDAGNTVEAVKCLNKCLDDIEAFNLYSLESEVIIFYIDILKREDVEIIETEDIIVLTKRRNRTSEYFLRKIRETMSILDKNNNDSITEPVEFSFIKKNDILLKNNLIREYDNALTINLEVINSLENEIEYKEIDRKNTLGMFFSHIKIRELLHKITKFKKTGTMLNLIDFTSKLITKYQEGENVDAYWGRLQKLQMDIRKDLDQVVTEIENELNETNKYKEEKVSLKKLFNHYSQHETYQAEVCFKNLQDVIIESNRDILDIAFENILANAIQYMVKEKAAGNIKISIETNDKNIKIKFLTIYNNQCDYQKAEISIIDAISNAKKGNYKGNGLHIIFVILKGMLYGNISEYCDKEEKSCGIEIVFDIGKKDSRIEAVTQ